MTRQEITSSLLKQKTEAKTSQKNDSYSCLKCGNKFEKPIFAVNNSPGVTEGYYACPLCLSKIKNPKDEETDEVPTDEEAPIVEEEEKGAPTERSPPVCPYHFGYLKKRPKNTPVPEECFTCLEMIDCMTR